MYLDGIWITFASVVNLPIAVIVCLASKMFVL